MKGPPKGPFRQLMKGAEAPTRKMKGAEIPKRQLFLPLFFFLLLANVFPDFLLV